MKGIGGTILWAEIGPGIIHIVINQSGKLTEKLIYKNLFQKQRWSKDFSQIYKNGKDLLPADLR